MDVGPIHPKECFSNVIFRQSRIFSPYYRKLYGNVLNFYVYGNLLHLLRLLVVRVTLTFQNSNDVSQRNSPLSEVLDQRCWV